MRFRFANEVGDGHIYNQNFQGRHSPRPIDSLEEILRDNTFERFSERGPDLVLLIGRENIDNAINRFRRARGMQRSEDEVTSCGGGQRQLNRLQITHFADQEDIRVFSQGAAERISK